MKMEKWKAAANSLKQYISFIAEVSLGLSSIEVLQAGSAIVREVAKVYEYC